MKGMFDCFGCSSRLVIITTEYLWFVCDQYFADRDIFCAGRVTEEDLQRVAAATGGTVQTSVNNLIDEVLPSHQAFN